MSAAKKPKKSDDELRGKAIDLTERLRRCCETKAKRQKAAREKAKEVDVGPALERHVARLEQQVAECEGSEA